ncbi:hypothetical protein XAP6164_560003 [Xanthomonas phaseoli pv. phaseoli]|nr:hypothetical protein XAP6164_560003 [Xanthomonas phaseoli pv. phaseoli]
MHWPVIWTAALQPVHSKRAHPARVMPLDRYRPCVRAPGDGKPVLPRDVVEAAHRLHHHKAWCGEGGICLHHHQERLLLLRSASGRATVALTAKTGIVNLQETGQSAHGFALGHDLHDLVLHPPSALVVDAQMAHQRQRGHIRLGRGKQVQPASRCATAAWCLGTLCRHALHW